MNDLGIFGAIFTSKWTLLIFTTSSCQSCPWLSKAFNLHLVVSPTVWRFYNIDYSSLHFMDSFISLYVIKEHDDTFKVYLKFVCLLNCPIVELGSKLVVADKKVWTRGLLCSSKMRYKLRSSKQPPRGHVPPEAKEERDEGEPSCKMRKTSQLHRRKTLPKPAEDGRSVASVRQGPQLTVMCLPQDVILLVVDLLDLDSSLAFLRSCKWFHSMLLPCDSFWKMLCFKTEFANYSCLEGDPHAKQVGWAGTSMHLDWRREDAGLGVWRKTWKRGIKMRKNVVAGNFQGWRLFSNSECPVTELSPGLDMNKVKQRLADFPKLSVNDDLKIDWDEKHLVLFHFFRGEGESCTIRLWDIEDEPRFLYQVDKGIECITDKVSVHNGHVVMVPSWPLEAQAMVMTLDINNKMAETGKYLFSDNTSQVTILKHI